MAHSIRHPLNGTIPTGPVDRSSSPDVMERQFGISGDDPARGRIILALAELKMRYGVDVDSRPDLVAQAIEKGRHDHAYHASLAPERPANTVQQVWSRPTRSGRDGVVYYLRVGNLVKIGTTVSLAERIRAYPPGAILLATEPGSYEVERERHTEFASALADRREWFYPSAALIEHINSLREQPLTAAEMAA